MSFDAEARKPQVKFKIPGNPVGGIEAPEARQNIPPHQHGKQRRAAMEDTLQIKRGGRALPPVFTRVIEEVKRQHRRTGGPFPIRPQERLEERRGDEVVRRKEAHILA
ncbi:MAG: hypothetical protein ACK40A_11955, partial [Pannonibacter indicus]